MSNRVIVLGKAGSHEISSFFETDDIIFIDDIQRPCTDLNVYENSCEIERILDRLIMTNKDTCVVISYDATPENVAIFLDYIFFQRHLFNIFLYTITDKIVRI